MKQKGSYSFSYKTFHIKSGLKYYTKMKKYESHHSVV